MEYYIDPNWFYWCSTLSNLKSLFIGIALIAGVLVPASIVIFLDDDMVNCKKLLIIPGIICFISALVAIFIPSKETLIEMQLARIVTKENVQFTINTLKEITDYIIMSLK